MANICETILNDFIAGALNRNDLEEGLRSIFLASANSATQSQLHIKKLYTENRLNDEQFTLLSETISSISIQATLDGTSPGTDISYFDEDKTLHLTDYALETIDEDADKTVIISTKSAIPTAHSPDNKKSVSIPTSVPATSESTKHKDLEPGVTLKNRFVLQERLGQGGMGVVYKAKDLLKVEAQDKNPYVAIKVLTDAFKKYSGSFIALQREASKAQKLAHPNIATVYDFDRDGDTVFMTMEYLAGKPLNQLIKQLPQKPLTKEEAINIIDQLCHGLAYAHEKQLIHSDFKPGNCFLLSDGTVKLLDFGIARASTSSGEESEKTMFDPSKLSAVTPAYATAEMFAGMNPDPRDDIYGLACVAYQLLAGGKHPYNKVAAPKVKELGIKPKPIKGLDRRQQKTLVRALTVNRDQRIPDVESFQQGIKSKKSHAKKIILGFTFLTIIGVGLGYQPFLKFQEEQALMNKVDQIKSGNKALMIETIWSLDKIDPEQRRILSVGLRREIIVFFKDRIKSVFNPKVGVYDYPQAVYLLSQAKSLYPDSVALSTIEDQVKEQKDRLMVNLVSLFNRYYKNNTLIKTESGEDLTTVLPLLRRVDPKHYLINDPKLPEAYLQASEKKIAERKFNQASDYIETGLKFFPDNIRLQSINKLINAKKIQ